MRPIFRASPISCFPSIKLSSWFTDAFGIVTPGVAGTNPSSNVSFLLKVQLDQNVSRDAKNINELRKLGWRVAVVWECAMRLKQPEATALTIGNWLKGRGSLLRLPLNSKMRRSANQKNPNV